MVSTVSTNDSIVEFHSSTIEHHQPAVGGSETISSNDNAVAHQVTINNPEGIHNNLFVDLQIPAAVPADTEPADNTHHMIAR